MNARQALEQSYNRHRDMSGGDILAHPKLRQLFGLVLRGISDPQAQVTTWDDVMQVIAEASTYLTDDAAIQQHFTNAFAAVVRDAKVLAPTYINPPPFE
jgi:hypothetical protein